MSTASTTLFTLIGIFTAVGGLIADFNETHIYNPRWPPHAKFHGGQTMSLGLSLGLLTLFITHRPLPSTRSSSEILTVRKERLQYAAIAASMYWVTQASSLLYPGTLAIDPEFGEGAPQLYIDAVTLSLVGVAYWLGMNGIRGKEKGL